jgi:hypothetical protein
MVCITVRCIPICCQYSLKGFLKIKTKLFSPVRIQRSEMNKLFFCFLIFYCSTLSAQQLVFDMSVFGFTFGKMVVTKTTEDDSTELYTLHAKGKTDFLWMKREDETTYEVRFRNGKLLSSHYKQIESGVTKHWTKVLFDGQKYQVDSYRGKRNFTEAPDYSVLSLYFNPHQNRGKIFYEAESDFTNLNYGDDDEVEIKGSDGSRTIYHFKNGKVSEIVVHISIATVRMKRIN